MATNWDELKGNYGSYQSYAKPGIYKTKCIDVEFREVGSNGSIAEEFIFEDTDDKKYPKATHWLTFKEGKEGWRKWHNLNLMIVLGSSEENAKKAIDKIEDLDGKEKITKGYETAFKALLKKKPEIEIEVYPDGKYSRSEFTDERVAMPHDDAKPAATSVVDEVVPEDIEDGEIDLSEIPF